MKVVLMEARVKILKKDYWLYLFPENPKEKRLLKRLFKKGMVWVSPQLICKMDGEPESLVYHGRKEEEGNP